MHRRGWLCALLGGGLAPAAALAAPAALRFPRDDGAHLESGIEWWYATGWLGRFEAPRLGFQVTFFRRRTGLAQTLESRFAARQLLFAHAALTDLGTGRHLHTQRVARWSGAADAGAARASDSGTDVHIGRWRLRDEGTRYRIQIDDDLFALDLVLQRSQPRLLQGDAGLSRKGPQPTQFSHYVTEPQLRVEGSVAHSGQVVRDPGLAWLDHEWSDQLMDPQAVGWDWIGINLDDGAALTAFRLRRADGSSLWAGGSWRSAVGELQSFGPDAVRFHPGRSWTSPASNAVYPVEWTVETPAGVFQVAALVDGQELDSRASTGTMYWEGLSELRDGARRRIGLGYLEMTGYAGRLRL